MSRTRFSAEQIANWFIRRFNQDVPNGGEYLTQLKLQKLMYFSQGFNLALYNKPLFNGDIIHRQYGPVVKSLADHFMKKNQSAEPIKELFNIDTIELEGDTLALLEVVYKRYGQYSSYKLVEISHQTEPWQNTKEGEIITLESIRKYFKEKFIVNG